MSPDHGSLVCRQSALFPAAAAAVIVYALALLAARGETVSLLRLQTAGACSTAIPETPDGGIGGDSDAGGDSGRGVLHGGAFACNVIPHDPGGEESHDGLLWAILCALGLFAIPRRRNSTER